MVEYLGENYPCYHTSIFEAIIIVKRLCDQNDQLLEQTTEYLSQQTIIEKITIKKYLDDLSHILKMIE